MEQVLGVLGGGTHSPRPGHDLDERAENRFAGQLGRMLVADASRLGITVNVLDPEALSPAKQVANHHGHRTGSFSDAEDIKKLAQTVDVLTVEIEHVNVAALAEVERTMRSRGGRLSKGVAVRPSSEVLRVIQDKYAQHQHLYQAGIDVAPFLALDTNDLPSSVKQVVDALGLPLMLKSKTLAYDGRGNYLLRTEGEVGEAIKALGGGARELYAEQIVNFACEVAVMVVRSVDGQTAAYPAVQSIHRDSICHLIYAPLRLARPEVHMRAVELAQRAVASLGEGAVGVFGVEMFLTKDGALVLDRVCDAMLNRSPGKLLVNEIAPRPHNSGHYTIEACATSQYENHLRAILGLPLGSTELVVPSAAMLNILGASADMGELDGLRLASLQTPGASLHLYGKAQSRAGRKLGHITLVASSHSDMDVRLRALLDALPSSQRDSESTPYTGAPTSAPLVSVIMGSDSDLRVMRKAADILKDFDVPFEVEIVSAHRTPLLMVDFAQQAASRGVRVIIAGAGGAAHLPGMVAALTSLPVIGVPIKGSTLDGVDSLHSIVQMPVRALAAVRCVKLTLAVQRGVPVATVAIDNATNAALLAIRIIGTSNESVMRKVREYSASMTNEVEGKRKRMAAIGYEEYA